jgi:8-oxo-dGTP diphosphatase
MTMDAERTGSYCTATHQRGVQFRPVQRCGLRHSRLWVAGRDQPDRKLVGVQKSLKQIVGAAILDNRAAPVGFLAARRTAPESLAGLWEFPGGKVEPGESCEDALRREIREELGVAIELGEEVAGPHEQGWPLNETAAMRVWCAYITDGRPEPLEDHDELRWVPLDEREATALPWIPADFPIVAAVLKTAATVGRPA